ncbi:MAG: acetate/propionate family kinase [Lysobacterales bacterium]
MDGHILVLNAGSSSLKFGLYDASAAQPALRLRGQISSLSRQPQFRVRDAEGRSRCERSLEASSGLSQAAALDQVLDWLAEAAGEQAIAAVGHRVVHGGMAHADPILLTPAVIAELRTLVPLAPLHQPHNLAAIARVAERHPSMPQVASFDTAFHRSNSDLVQRYALPEALHQAGVRRYGFHGLSYAYIAGVLQDHDRRAAEGRTIVLHLGSGASLCALQGGVSVASSMGFSALDGIPMASRCGALDPGVILYLLQERGMSADQVQELLYQQSGLLGLSGISGDLQRLSESSAAEARLAIDVFVYRIVREIGSLAAAMGGLDALVFTAGIGEHSALVRAGVCEGLEWLGMRLDVAANARHAPCISTRDSGLLALVIATDEESVIAADTARVLG